MSAVRIKSTIKKGVDLAFAVFGDLVQEANFKKVIGYTVDPLSGLNVQIYATAEVDYIRTHFLSQDLDGQSILFGDERWLVKASELVAISPQPSSGDWFEASGQKVDIKAALLDPTENVWTFQVRRSLSDVVGAGALVTDDWGDLTAHTLSEDWSDLSLHDTAEDWNL